MSTDTTRELLSERLWRLCGSAEERADRAALNLDRAGADRHLARAAELKDQAREAERLGR